MTFKIEKDVSIPSMRGRPRKVTPYPLAEMEIGDSFLITNEMIEQNPQHKYARQEVQRYRSLECPDRKYTTRKVPEGVRVWRTA